MSEALSDDVAILEFGLGHQRFGIVCELVTEVLPLLPIRRLPGSPPAILGVAEVRGALLPLLDPRGRLGLPPWKPAVTANIIAVRSRALLAGLVVDSVEDVLTIPWSSICRPGELEPRVPYSLGLFRWNERSIVVVDVDAMVTHDEWKGVTHAVEGR